MSQQPRSTMSGMVKSLISAEDLLREDSPWRDHEIWDGLPVVCEPSGGEADSVAARIVIPLGAYVYARRLGHMFLSSQGFLLARDPDRLLAPDGAFVAKARLPHVPKHGFLEMAPDFCIEVRSPADGWEAAVEKCGIWLAHGVQVAWAIDPLARRVAVFRHGLSSEVLHDSGTINASPALPGFSLDLGDIFPTGTGSTPTDRDV